MKKATRIFALLLAMIMVLGLVACGGEAPAATEAPSAGSNDATQSGGNEAAATETTKDTLVLRLDADPGSLDNVAGHLSRAVKIRNFVANDLFVTQYDENGNKTYGVDDRYSLATGYEYDDDNMGMTIYLRQGVKFHNGDEMKASDVLFSFARYAVLASQYYYIDFDNITAIDDYTVHVAFTEPSALAMPNIAVQFHVYSERAFKEASSEGAAIAAEFCGTGPYKIVEWVSGDSIKLVRNEDYFGGQAKIENVLIRVIPEAAVAMMEAEVGSVDIIDLPAATDVADVVAGTYDGVIKHEQALSAMMLNLGFNTTPGKPTSDLRVRQAICYALNRDELQYGAYDGVGEVGYTIFSKTFEGQIDMSDDWMYQQDVEKAKQLMADAGYADGFTLTLIHNNTAEWVLVAQIMAHQLEQIGITLDIQGYDAATYNQIMTNEPDGWDLWLRTWGGNGCFASLVTNQVPMLTYISKDDPAFEKAYDLAMQAAGTLDEAARIEIEKEIQEMWLGEINCWYPLIQQYSFTLYADNLMDFVRIDDFMFVLDAYFA